MVVTMEEIMAAAAAMISVVVTLATSSGCTWSIMKRFFHGLYVIPGLYGLRV